MDKTTSYPTAQLQQGYLAWDYIPKDSAIKKWVAELGQLTAGSVKSADWDMVGHAVLLEADAAEEVQEVLHHVAHDASMQLHIIDCDQVVADFPQWLDALPRDVPSIVYLTPGQWLGGEPDEENSSPPRDPQEDEKSQAFRRQLIDVLRKRVLAHPMVFVTVGQSCHALDPLLRHAGLFDRRIRVSELPDHGLVQSFIAEVGLASLAPSITLQPHKLASILRHEYHDRRRRGLMQKAMQRLAWKERRQLEIEDLLYFVAYGTSEIDSRTDDRAKKRRHAIHEAGHALISHLDSREKMPPAYCSVLKQIASHGIVVPSYQAHELNSDDLTYGDFTHKVRVMLGGRAAEHLLLGPNDISAMGSMSDLEKATRMAGKMFAIWGIPLDASTDLSAGANLAVVIEKTSDSESLHIETLVRKFLQKQFLITLSLIRQNRDYFDKIVEALIDRTILVQKDFENLWTRSPSTRCDREIYSEAAEYAQ
jgi:hypothetical protein